MKEDFDDIILKLKKERDYQDYMCSQKNLEPNPSIEAELLMLKGYIDKTIQLWTKNPSDEKVLSEIRKMGGITIRCLQNNGCPNRNVLKGFMTE